jgi:hypothetical protein
MNASEENPHMNTAITESLTALLDADLITAGEHATLVRMTQDDYVASLSMESGDDGLFFPANETEYLFARYWTDEHYSWREMVDDIADFAEASAILSTKEDAYWFAASALGEEDSARAVLRSRLYEADDEENRGIKQSIKQAACDAVEFVSISGVALAAARAIDIDNEEELAALLVESANEDSE